MTRRCDADDHAGHRTTHSPSYQPRQPPGLSSRTRAKPTEGSAVGITRRSNLAVRSFIHGGLEPALRASRHSSSFRSSEKRFNQPTISNTAPRMPNPIAPGIHATAYSNIAMAKEASVKRRKRFRPRQVSGQMRDRWTAPSVRRGAPWQRAIPGESRRTQNMDRESRQQNRA